MNNSHKAQQQMLPKEKLFHLYAGQMVFKLLGLEHTYDRPMDKIYDEDYLQLRDKSDLGDEEKQSILDILRRTNAVGNSLPVNQVDILLTRYMRQQSNITGIEWLYVLDYLRSISVALPVTLLESGKPITYSVEQMVEMGWVKLEGRK